jgi:RNA-binding protein
VKTHHLTVSVFSGKEGAGPLKAALAGMLPEGAAVEERIIGPEADAGVFRGELIELRVRLSRQVDVMGFLSVVLGGLDDYDRRRLLEGVDSAVDDGCNLYIRLSKQEFLDGNFVLESKDPLHVKVKLAVYPARREKAVEAAKELIGCGGG